MNIDPMWLIEFDTEMRRMFAIDHAEAGMSTTELSRYADLLPRTAAKQFGEDYDLDRLDLGWR
ncbi:hypothetical protein [Pseudoxanthomonas winnipegensis]|uniref:hypothetical protein n=1 Tax=Pseudoxanthomonas winnipegensis TaxID=2480810 RepID=UPI001038CF19|nr:hypothetical protein [Pseudoxanthomonas winnipegensis]TBV69764.1 hypothetical protein EYC45_19135 [Pseudoxanthomonas winnipegensis]